MVTEKESMDLVIKFETERTGKPPENVSGIKRLGYDLKSIDNRCIEVKKRDVKYDFVFITDYEFRFFLKNKDAYLYVVFYDGEKTDIKMFDRDKVLTNLHDATKRYRVHINKAMKGNSKEKDL